MLLTAKEINEILVKHTKEYNDALEKELKNNAPPPIYKQLGLDKIKN